MPTEKPEAIASGFSVGTEFGVRPPFKLPLKQEIFFLAVPIGHGEQFDQLAVRRGVGSESLTPFGVRSPFKLPVNKQSMIGSNQRLRIAT